MLVVSVKMTNTNIFHACLGDLLILSSKVVVFVNWLTSHFIKLVSSSIHFPIFASQGWQYASILLWAKGDSTLLFSCEPRVTIRFSSLVKEKRSVSSCLVKEKRSVSSSLVKEKRSVSSPLASEDDISLFSVLFITITSYVGVIPPQRPPASPHQGCQGPPGLDMQNCKISYNIQYIF